MSTANLLQKRRAAEAQSTLNAVVAECNEARLLVTSISVQNFTILGDLHAGFKKLNDALAEQDEANAVSESV